MKLCIEEKCVLGELFVVVGGEQWSFSIHGHSSGKKLGIDGLSLVTSHNEVVGKLSNSCDISTPAGILQPNASELSADDAIKASRRMSG